MIKTIILIPLRKLAKEKATVCINIFSLALGVASVLILGLYLKSELTYDQHYTNHKNIYRVSSIFEDPGLRSHFAIIAEGFGPLLIQDNPQIGEHVRFRSSTESVLGYEDQRFAWDSIWMVDENYFEVFNHEILAGDPQTAFNDIYSIAISGSMAQRYFGDEDPIGKTLESDNFSYRVTLVFADPKENTHLKFDALYPYQVLRAFNPDYIDNYISGLFNVNGYTYLHFNPDFNLEDFPAIVDAFMDKYLDGDGFLVELTPLDQIHYSEGLLVDRPTGNIFYLYGFAAVAIFILLVACINTINLATARAMSRTKEVGMRKVVGASQRQLILQFLGESTVFTIVATFIGIALALCALTFTPMGSLMGNDALLTELASVQSVMWIVGLGCVVALGSGLYPAFYLSSISPMSALTRKPQSWKTGMSVRQVLVLTQIAVSIGVVTCTLLMSQQMQYVANKPLGFSGENKVWLRLRGADAIEAIPAMRNELLALSSINAVTQTQLLPQYGTFINPVSLEASDGETVRDTVDFMNVGQNYINAMSIELLAGRTFSDRPQRATGSDAIVNETLVNRMGWDEPIGKQISGFGDRQWTVIGVTADFHYAPLNNTIGPLVMLPLQTNFTDLNPQQRLRQSRTLLISIANTNTEQTFQDIEQVIRRFDPNHIFDPVFLDTELDALYRTETNLMNLTEIFAGVCIVISVMGLFGLASYNSQQRRKELAVRKVLGASSFNLLAMLSRNIILLIAVASIPALIVSYLTIDSWLERFAYRAEPGLIETIMPFAAAVFMISLVALLTVVVQSWKTASQNPVEALRVE